MLKVFKSAALNAVLKMFPFSFSQITSFALKGKLVFFAHPAPRRQVSPRPCRAPGGFPAILATGSTTGTDPPPTASGISTCAAQVYPALGALPERFQPQWPSPRAQLGSPPPTPPGADTRPAPPGFAPPLPRSRGAAHLHQWLLVSPVPTPGSRRGSRTSLLPPGQT